MGEKFCALLEEQLALERGLCERDKDDAFYSTYRVYKCRAMERYLAQLKSGMTETALREELPDLERQLAEEEAHPRFYWYDEHHYAKLLCGEADGCKEVLRMLAAFTERSLRGSR